MPRLVEEVEQLDFISISIGGFIVFQNHDPQRGRGGALRQHDLAPPSLPLGNQQSLLLEQIQSRGDDSAVGSQLRRQQGCPRHFSTPRSPQEFPTQVCRDLLGRGANGEFGHGVNVCRFVQVSMEKTLAGNVRNASVTPIFAS